MAHELTRPPSRAAAQRDGRMSLRMRSDTFERLFEEHAGRLFSFLVYRTGNRALAEDLLSETFERVMRSRQRFDPRRGSERRWLYTIALNLLRDQARRQTHDPFDLLDGIAAHVDGFGRRARLVAEIDAARQFAHHHDVHAA